ncbi:protocadherin Fat 3-like [Pimephales promelas]|uniref:protocadherin Fat 3-like n=1 Tax=Pimephales promelas TaxID=90988 RepID=UPI001955D9BB|nr:protocadherin Fat 3-like [Pimephales promelas]
MRSIRVWKQAARWLFVFPLLWNTIGAQIRYTIPEELKEGSVVGNIAKDIGLDISDIANRKLRIASDSSTQYFSVDTRNGELIVNGRIDREALCGQSASCLMPLQLVIENPLQLYRVNIEIQDINDNSPNFHTKENVLKIWESVAVGAKFPFESAEDLDVGSNSLKSYTLSNNAFFRLNVKTLEDGKKVPELIIDKPLDREKQSVHKLILTALDGGDPVKSGTIMIQVIVQDINDNEPKFEQSQYKASVQESTTLGSSVLTVKATDLDEGLNGEIQYFFGAHTPDHVRNIFSINVETGDITVIGKLDYELTKLYTFDVCAKDKGSPEQEGHSSVRLDIIDENDNIPEIILTSLPSPVSENASVGTVVALINVKDLDSGNNGKVNLTISSRFPFKLKPAFDNHYSLVTDSLLDREANAEYDIELEAKDSGVPSLKSRKTLNVKILDVNDNPPVFSQTSYTVYIKENSPPGASLFSVSASDIDQDKNAILSYSILDLSSNHVPASSYFYINSENGTIYSMSSFDYEKTKLFSVLVQAKDHGSPSLSSNVTVHVFILDHNDNAPAVIYPSTSMGSVPNQRMPRSAKAGHLVTKVTAVDADSGHNAWLFYRLAEATDASLFSVNLHTGEVRTKRAVSEQDDPSQRLMIEIKDNGEPIQSTTVTVDILIEDGFHEPISDYREKTIEPNKKSGKITLYLIISLAAVSLLCLMTFFILLVKCARGSRGGSSCCIRRTDSGYKNPNRNLQIQLNTDGPIKYVEVLGGDMMSQSQSFGSYLSPMSEFSDLTLVKPSSTTNFTDTLNVLDASLPDSAWTFESQQVRRRIINYLKWRTAFCFFMDIRSRFVDGNIKRNREMRHRRIRGWKLAALWLFAFSLLWNTVGAQIRYTIPEELKEGSIVGNIAKDLGFDISDIADRKLRIASESNRQYFNVDSGKGDLVVNGRIDRETLCGQSASCLMPLQVVIENPLQMHNVEIEIQDINDNAPNFHNKNGELYISELTAPGTRFPLEIAEDLDVGSNSLKTYSLSNNNFFRLNLKTLKNGRQIPELVLDKSLDREKQSVHKLILTALDGGNPVKSGTSLLQIIVQDFNDNEPTFEVSAYKASVVESAVVGSNVIKIKATDLDEGPNGEIQYSFSAHTPELVRNAFTVNAETGEITVTEKLDYETTKSYTFDVCAKDKGNPELEGQSSVQIDIIDENDNPPEIILTSLPSPVPENATVGTVVALITVKDLDSGNNGKVELIVSPDVPFKLKPSHNYYSLITDSFLDREVHSEYSVEILAIDSGVPPLKTVKTIYIKVLDVNDNPPVFSQTSYNVYIKENNLAGTSLFYVSASDIDQNKNALLTYSILDLSSNHVPASSYFYLNSENGTIYTMSSFDYEKIKLISIVVQAKDHGSPSLSSNATVHVFILDRNDNAPAVIYPSTSMGSVPNQRMPRSAKAGHLVTKVTAVDADSGHNAWLFYRLAEATDASLFSVNLHTGEVRTKRAVSEQDDPSQRLMIEIKDNGEPIQSTTVTVDILIEDGFHEPISDYRDKTIEPNKKSGKITLYLIISLASVSLLCLMTFFILLVKCARGSRGGSSCCIRRTDSGYKNPNRNLQIQLNTDGPIKYVEVLGGDMMSQSQSFGSYLSPMSEFSDLTLVKPSSTTNFTDTLNVLDASLPDSAWTFESQQVRRRIINYVSINIYFM